MNIDLLNYGLAFLEGFALILSPCILPILPIVLAGGLSGGKRRPLGIIIGFTLFFALFSLLAGFLIRHIGINLDFIRNASYILIIVFGVILVSDYLSNLFSRFTQKFADTGNQYADKSDGPGLFSGIVFGGLVSLIWVPCGGPILAAAIVSMAVQKTFLASFLTFLCFAFGSVLPMILIVFVGKKVMHKVSFLKTHSHLLRKIFGVIIIVSALIASLGGFSAGSASQNVNSQTSQTSLKSLYSAPELNTNTTWLNSPPLTMQALKGKVVLVDFWTYSCINCIRTLPYLHDWYQKYHDKGLVIIGVHAPEFEFEKSVDNVKHAIKQYDIQYPVVLDNDYVIWQNYHNHYWPAHYLINKDGQVVEEHFGEGNYAETEANIRTLLGLSGTVAATPEKKAHISFTQTPETYLGYARAQNYAGNPSLVSNQAADYHFPTDLASDAWALQGKWVVKQDEIQSSASNTAIRIHFAASHVYVVMGTTDDQPVTVTVFLNKMKQSSFVITVHNLYPVLSLPETSAGELELQFDKPGAQVYTFTFG